MARVSLHECPRCAAVIREDPCPGCGAHASEPRDFGFDAPVAPGSWGDPEDQVSREQEEEEA